MRRPLVVSYGGGVNSLAMLVGYHERGEVPDAVVFSDTGGEKPETYFSLRIAVRGWMARLGFPDNGVDLVANGLKIQVKTSSYNNALLVLQTEEERTNTHLAVLVAYHKKTHRFRLCGYIPTVFYDESMIVCGHEVWWHGVPQFLLFPFGDLMVRMMDPRSAVPIDRWFRNRQNWKLILGGLRWTWPQLPAKTQAVLGELFNEYPHTQMWAKWMNADEINDRHGSPLCCEICGRTEGPFTGIDEYDETWRVCMSCSDGAESALAA